jgi:hypothetical protein
MTSQSQLQGICTVKLDRLQFICAEFPELLWELLGQDFKTEYDRWVRPRKGKEPTYARVRRHRSRYSDALLDVEYSRCHGWLPQLKCTAVADDRTGITYKDLLHVLTRFNNALFTMAEVALDFRPRSGVDRAFVKRHGVFGKSRFWVDKRFPQTLYYGTRKAEKLVRCYRKPPYRVELELHSRWMRKWRIDDEIEELIQHIADDLCRAHVRFVQFDWRALAAHLSRLGVHSERILKEAEARARSIHELVEYLKGSVRLHNPHRFLKDLEINGAIQKALRRWASTFSFEPNAYIANRRIQMLDPKTQATRLLQSRDFFRQFLSAVRKAGLIREERNALIVYAVAVSRLLPDPLQLFVKGKSSAGKNFLVKTVLQFLPRSQVSTISSTSENVLSYQGKKLSHKVLYVHEQKKSSGSVYPTRLLISEKELIREVTVRQGGKLTRRRYVTKGPVASISTTTEDQLEVDDESRRISTWIDESAEQTRQIIKGTWTQSRGVLTPDEQRVWHFVQRILAERAKLPIELPSWFGSLAELVTCRDLRLRRYANAFQQACRAVCLIRSFERPEEEVRKSGKLRVGFIDVAVTQLIFDRAFAESLRGRDDQQDKVTEAVRRLVAGNGGAPVNAKSVAEEIGISLDKAYARLREATRKGALRQANKPQQTNLKLYLPVPEPTFLPEPGVIHRRLGFKGRYGFIHPLSGDWVVYGNPRTDS